MPIKIRSAINVMLEFQHLPQFEILLSHRTQRLNKVIVLISCIGKAFLHVSNKLLLRGIVDRCDQFIHSRLQLFKVLLLIFDDLF